MIAGIVEPMSVKSFFMSGCISPIWNHAEALAMSTGKGTPW
ncbi:Uncharacterised protein [Prescottella equi]|nr:Uncharacterised protein [Prescottella equi]